jgi:hypothetical protein
MFNQLSSARSLITICRVFFCLLTDDNDATSSDRTL